MGSLSSVIAPIASFGVSAGKYILSNKDAKEISIRNTQLEQNTALQKQQNLLDLQAKETDRASRLRRALSSQRAQFGGRGIGSAEGSSEAVLQGLNEESDVDRQVNFAKNSLDNTAIDQNYNTQRQLNLLQKQQLKQKSALGFLGNLA